MSKKNYTLIGEKITVYGQTYYAPGYYDDGWAFGRIYKDEQAFYENPDEICYIHEYAFEEADFIVANGKKFYCVGGFTRKDLEFLVKDTIDEDGRMLHVEDFFCGLNWQSPETYYYEIAQDY